VISLVDRNDVGRSLGVRKPRKRRNEGAAEE
jgi:hypothetical protein